MEIGQINTNETVTATTCEIQCDVYCAIGIVLIIVGLVANGLVVWRVVKDKELWEPTFIAIAGLAVADMGFLIAYFAVEEIKCPANVPAYETGETLMLSVYMTMWFTSATHILLLSTIRFILILNPLRSLAYLTVRRTVFMSAAIWLTGVLLGILHGVLSALKEFNIYDSDSLITMDIIVIMVSYFIPLVSTIILHIIKLKAVCKALRSALPEQVRQMSLMVTVTILLFTLLPLPQVVTLFIICFSDDLGFIDNSGVSWSLSLGLLLNSCVNPFVYAIFSRLFRKSLVKQFCQSNLHTRSNTCHASNHGFEMGRRSHITRL